jgi:hypothetical protein
MGQKNQASAANAMTETVLKIMSKTKDVAFLMTMTNFCYPGFVCLLLMAVAYLSVKKLIIQ